MKLNKIHNMDCLEGMKLMKDNSVDICITSPPYNISDNKYEEYKDNLSDDDYVKFLIEVIDEMLRVSKYYVFFNIQVLKKNKKSMDKLFSYLYSKGIIKQEFIWAKRNPVSLPTPLVANGFEKIFCLTKDDNNNLYYKNCNYNRANYVSSCIIKPVNNENNNTSIHKATFPSWLPEFFIKNFTKENMIVLDPFMGLATTAMASKKLNRKYIGFELSKKYCDVSNEKIRQYDIQRRLPDWF
jgi:site-specific DNA-methyltransferase (adenine-specific)